MNNRKIMIFVAIVLSLIWSTNLFALSDATAEAGEKALLGVAFAIQLLILGGIILLIKFCIKRYLNPKKRNNSVGRKLFRLNSPSLLNWQ